jgi:ferredoxin-NADP reductase
MNTLVQERTTSQRQLLTAELTESMLLSPQTKHLELRVVGVEEFRFVPGQFVSIKQPRPDGKVHTRAYSLASPPRSGPSFDLCLNRVEEGFLSNWLCDLEVGATVQFHGPHGLFVLREPRQDAIFIATGTGIAPIRSMVEWLFAQPERNRGHEYWLVFGTRYEHSLYYRNEFEQIARNNANFHYVPTLSRCGEDWQGGRGYVQDHVRRIVAGRHDMQAYLCGLNQMVAANRKLLVEELGWDRKQVIFERFD